MRKIWWLLSIILVLSLLLWMFLKPSRVMLPELVGLSCYENNVCVDDVSRLKEAQSLRGVALKNIEQKLGSFDYEPKIIFCATQECFESFGFLKAAAQTVHTFATVVSPRGWKPYYVEHELIHQWQFSKVGFKMYFAPQWLLEGMAYGLSDDERKVLKEPFESYKNQFLIWYKSVDKKNLIQAIKGTFFVFD